MAAPELHDEQEIELLGGDRTTIALRIVAGTALHLTQHRDVWRPKLAMSGALDADWDWLKDFQEVELESDLWETYAVAALDGRAHALMSITFNTHDSRLAPGMKITCCLMADGGKILPFDLAKRFANKRVNDIEFTVLVETLISVIESHLEPRLNAEVRKAVSPLQAEIVRLRESLVRVSDYVERVKLGDADSASLVVTDDAGADVSLARAKIDQEARYPFSTVDVASHVPGNPSTTRVATVIKGLGLKGDPHYWCELTVGNTVFNRYSQSALDKVRAAFSDPRGILAENTPAFRTIVDFLEGQ